MFDFEYSKSIMKKWYTAFEKVIDYVPSKSPRIDYSINSKRQSRWLKRLLNRQEDEGEIWTSGDT